MSENYKYVYGEFWSFLRNPLKDLQGRVSIIEKLQIFIPLIFLELLITICLGVLIAGLNNHGLNSFNKIKLQMGLHYTPVWFIIIVIAVIVPIIEEVFFRLSLRYKAKYMHFNVIILVTGFTLLLQFFFKQFHYKIAVIILGVILAGYYFFKKKSFDYFLLAIWDRNYFYVFYFSVLAFGLLHLTNLQLKSISFLLLPILILPQSILGLFCGYIRLKIGFIWSCLFHSIHNFIFILPMLIVVLIPVSKKYSIEIVEQSYADVFSNWRITNDTIEFERLKICDIFPKLLRVDSSNIEFEDSEIANKILTINFTKIGREASGKTRSSENIIIDELLRKYDLKIDRKLVDREIYQMQIIDSVKLNFHNQNNKENLPAKGIPALSDNEINLHNADLKIFAKTISLNFSKDVFYYSTYQNKYTIKIPKLEFEELNQYMEDQYGITLKKSISKVSVYEIKRAD
jgi:hypothetical protein